MANGLLKKLALGTAIAGSAMFGAREAKATPMNWSSFTELVPRQGANTSDYLPTFSGALPNTMSAICYAFIAGVGGVPVGGFDVVNGNITQSYFNQGTAPYYVGILSGDSANTGSGANPRYYWEVFHDTGDPGYGPIVEGNPGSYSEIVDASKYSISNFSPLDSVNPGTLKFTYVPEPKAGFLTLLGAVVLALRRRYADWNNQSAKSTK